LYDLCAACGVINDDDDDDEKVKKKIRQTTTLQRNQNTNVGSCFKIYNSVCVCIVYYTILLGYSKLHSPVAVVDIPQVVSLIGQHGK